MSATQTTPSNHKAPKAPRNGVDTPKLLATINAVGQQPEMAKFQFRARNTWLSGNHSRTTIDSFYGAGQEMSHRSPSVIDVDHPEVLAGEDHAPSPVEFVLHALAGCLTAGLANIAAARGVTLTEVSSTVEGDIDLRGVLGLSDEVRNGYEQIRVNFVIKGDAPDETLRALVEQSQARSAVYDIITNRVPVSVSVTTA